MFEPQSGTPADGGSPRVGAGSHAHERPAPPAECQCANDGYSTCEHAQDLVRQLVTQERRHAEAWVREVGLDGLRELARAGDPWALDLLDEVWVAVGPEDDDRCGDLPEDPLATELMARWGHTETAESAAPASPSEAGNGTGLGTSLSALQSMRPGPELAALLAGIDLEETDAFSVVEVVAAYKRLEAWSAGRAALAAADLSSKICPIVTAAGKALDGSAEELAMRLAVSRQEAAKLVRVGHGLQGLFSETGAALVAGEIDFRRAASIVTTLDGGSSAVAWVVEQEVLPGAGRRTPTMVERDLVKALIAVDPDEAQLRHTKARATRRVSHTQTLPDGMGRISAVLDGVDCVTLDLVLDSIAQTAKADGDQRTMVELRADGLMALVTGALHTGWAGRPPGHTCTPDLPKSTVAGDLDAGPPPANGTVSTASRGEPDRAGRVSHGPAGAPSITVPGSAVRPSGSPGSCEATGSQERELESVTGGSSGPSAVSTADRSRSPGSAVDDVGRLTPQARPATPTAPDRRIGPGDGQAVPPDRGTGMVVADGPGIRPGDGGAVPPDPGRNPASGATPGTVPAPLVGEPRTASDSAAPGRCTAPNVLLPPLDLLITERDAMPLGVAPVLVRLTIPLSVATPPADGDGAIAGRSDGSELDIADALDRPAVEVAEMAGYGPVTPDVARALAAGGTWRRVVTDPLSGAVLDLGRSRYRPPADLVEHVRQRDRTCVRPGCGTPAHRCQIDHTRAYSQGGATSAANCGPMCLRDHQLKSAGAFRVAQPTPGVFEWATPTGHCYRREVDGTVTVLPSPSTSLDDAIPF